MMKKIFLAVAMFLLVLLAFAQTGSGTKTVTIMAGDSSVTVTKDSTCTIVSGADTLLAIIPATAFDSTESTPQIVTVDDESYILSRGRAYVMDDILDNFDEIRFAAFHNEDTSGSSSKVPSSQVLPVIAICFIVPCITLVIALALLLAFFMKRTRARNAIIEKAIDANYMLPDSFYSNSQTTQPVTDTPAYDSSNSGTEASQGHAGPFQPTAPSTRDPKSFSSAVTLLAVGFALILFFGINGKLGLGCLAGGVPFFLGLGKLFGYYFVPGFTSGNKQKSSYQRNPYNGNYQTPHYTPNQNAYPGSYPPPFNPGDRHDTPMPPRQ